MDIAPYLLQLFSGLSRAMVLFLLSAGLSLIFGVMNILNFAHATLWLLSGYITYSIFTFLSQQFGVSPWMLLPAIAGAVALMALVGFALERFLIRHTYEVRGSLESLAARLAAERATPAQRSELIEHAAASLGAAQGQDTDGFRRHDGAFHDLLAAAAANPYLARLIDHAYTPGPPWTAPPGTCGSPRRSPAATAPPRQQRPPRTSRWWACSFCKRSSRHRGLTLPPSLDD